MALPTSIRGQQIKDAFFGAGLARNGTDGNIMDVQVDNSSIEISGDALQVKASGITDAMLANDYIQTSEVDGTTIEFSGGTLNVVANGIGAAELDETDTYDFSSGVVSVATPTADAHAATKAYVDGLVNGLDWKNSVRLATYADTNWTTSASIAFSDPTLTITGLTAGTSRGLVDSVEPVDGDRILVKDAAAASAGAAADDQYNGIWVVTGGTTTSLTLTRATDADSDAEVTSGLAAFVEEGTQNADNGYVLTTNDPITVNTTDLTFTQFTGAGQIIAGVGLTKTGNTIDLDLDTLTAAVVDVAADEVAIIDATDGSTKKEAIADIVTAVAGNGLAAASGVLSLDVNELTEAAVDVATDYIVIEDATDNSTKKEAVADVVTAVAGNGLAASSGVLSVDLNELSTEATFDPAADYVGIVDATDSGSDKSLWSVIATAIAGTGITATNGVLSVDSITDNVVESDFVSSVQTATNGQTVMTSVSSSNPVIAASVLVALNGMVQKEGGSDDYTIATATGVVTFNTGLETGDIVTIKAVLDN